MQPEYVAYKSGWRAVTPLRILFFWLIIPLIVILVSLIKLKHQQIEFYEDRVIEKSGVFSRHEKNSTFYGILSVSIDQSLGGRMFHYGDIKIDVVGKWDIDTHGIKYPSSLKSYLETRRVDKNALMSSIRTMA